MVERSFHTDPRSALFSEAAASFPRARRRRARRESGGAADPPDTPAGAVCTKTSEVRAPAAEEPRRFVSSTTTKKFVTPPSVSASPSAPVTESRPDGRAARRLKRERPFDERAKTRPRRVFDRGPRPFECGTTTHVAGGSFAAASSERTRPAPRTSRGGSTATTTIDSRGGGGGGDDDGADSPFAVIARRRARARPTVGATSARIASSVAGRGALANDAGSCRGAPRSCRAAASRARPIETNGVVARRPRRGVHAARGPPATRRSRNSGGARRRHVDTIHDRRRRRWRAGRARARSRLAVRARLIIIRQRALFAFSRRKSRHQFPTIPRIR